MYCAMHPRLRTPTKPARISLRRRRSRLRQWVVGGAADVGGAVDVDAYPLGGGLLRARRRDGCTPRVVGRLGLLRGHGGGVDAGPRARRPPELGDVASQVGADAGRLDLVDLPAAAPV